MSTAAQTSDVRSLIGRGDDYARSGDLRAAMSFYQAALQAAQGSRFADAQTRAELQRAQAFIQQRARDFQNQLEHALDDIRPEDSPARTRLSHALDMLAGKRSIYPQQPTVLYYPYLAQRQFFEREEFGWVAALEAQSATIREELIALLDERADFRPYVEDDPDRPRRDFHGLNNSPDWTALYLWKDGALVEENARRCPRTIAALEAVPVSKMGQRSPSVLFSRLEPGAHIPSHHGMLNSRLICHLPLIVPHGCWLRVGNETREVEQGRMLIFDDSIEHEARNTSGEVRIVLLFDMWRPELSEAERRGISAIFDAIDAFQALPDA